MSVNSLQWYHIDSLGAPGDQIVLGGDEWHHSHHVMRHQPGQHIMLCDGKGCCMESRIISSSGKEGKLELLIDHSDQYKDPRTYKISMGIAPTKNIDRIEFAVEKLVEIGIDEICFLDCDHNERTHLRMDRMKKIAVAAAKQSRKAVFPAIENLITPLEYIVEKKRIESQSDILACHLEDLSKSITENYIRGRDVILLIGPEGGFSSRELESMKSHNVKTVLLGPFRLRVETAAIIACAQVHFINQSNS